MMGGVYLAGALVGLIGGAVLTPRKANESTLGMFILSGAILGVLGSHFMIHLGDRRLRMSLARPVGGGMIGATFGLIVSRAIGQVVGWNTAPMLALVAAGAIIGVMIGMRRRS
jgi:predicted membrane protein